jgi:hypothetical protein
MHAAKVDGGKGTDLVTHHWGARVDGWFASVDETIGRVPCGCPGRGEVNMGAARTHGHHLLQAENGAVMCPSPLINTGHCSRADVCVLCLGTSSINGHSANDPKGRFSMWSPIQEVRLCPCCPQPMRPLHTLALCRFLLVISAHAIRTVRRWALSRPALLQQEAARADRKTDVVLPFHRQRCWTARTYGCRAHRRNW